MSIEDKVLAQLKMIQDDYPMVSDSSVTVLFNEIAPFLRTEDDERELRLLNELRNGGVDNWEWYGDVDWDYIKTGNRQADSIDSEE